jgi:hypothetical protein
MSFPLSTLSSDSQQYDSLGFAGHQFDQLIIGNLFSSNLIANPINIIDIAPLLPAAIFFRSN